MKGLGVSAVWCCHPLPMWPKPCWHVAAAVYISWPPAFLANETWLMK